MRFSQSQNEFVTLRKKKMPDKDLKERLINKIKEIDDPAILEEVANLFELQEPDAVFKTTDKQKMAIDEAKNQIETKQTLSNEQSGKEADEWLKE
jgi:hypothetical protein